MGESKIASIANGDDLMYFKIEPEADGTYSFYSTGSSDTYGFLYGSDYEQLAESDDDGIGYNFKITFGLAAGETYYLGAKFLNSTMVGSFYVHMVCEHENFTHHDAVSATCTEDGTIEYWSCDTCGKMFSDAEETSEITDVVEKATGHSWGEWEEVEGIEKRTCSVCHEEETREGSSSGSGDAGTDTGSTDTETGTANTDATSSTVRGEIYTVNGFKVKVANAATDGTGAVTVIGLVNKKLKKATIPATVTINGASYKVTVIANNAFKNCKKLTSITISSNVTKIGKKSFYGCKNLKSIKIKTKKLKSIGKKAFTGIHKKATFKVPKSKKKVYQKLLKSKVGFKKTMKIK